MLKSRINESSVELDLKALNAVALKTTPSRAHTEAALFGNSLVLKPLGIGDITLARLFDITGTGNRLLKIDMEGQEFDKFPPRDEPGVGWRSILQHQRIMLRRQIQHCDDAGLRDRPSELRRRAGSASLPLSLAEVYAYALRDRKGRSPTPRLEEENCRSETNPLGPSDLDGLRSRSTSCASFEPCSATPPPRQC